ncbi:VC0807 family protein [Streptomyces sp. RPT161]|uniref:VC0807 family protein n=1 Tax=Streptomyces sp. RPT161 TaxID=3015993 RepID=UPI0022B8FC96|nr:VC0807 family protein [Streptomyces sp. RPT161]
MSAPAGRAVLTMVVDIALPLVVFYGLRAAGTSTYAALVAAAVAPLASAALQLLRDRRLDGMAVFIATTMLLGLAASLVTGGTRFMLAKDGWVTAVGGLWFLASVKVARQPLVYHGARPLLEGRFRSDGTPWEVLWEREPAFRRIWRVSTVIWSVAMLADAAVRVTMAYTLPVDTVPALGGALWPVTLLLLQLVNGAYYEVAGLWRITGGLVREGGRADGSPDMHTRARRASLGSTQGSTGGADMGVTDDFKRKAKEMAEKARAQREAQRAEKAGESAAQPQEDMPNKTQDLRDKPEDK